ncbi:MAG: hypothetical protein Q8O52_04000 [Sulfuritalea sp.]|nr:hypothetical protein [Sulfuritalea sp.]
MTGEQNLGLIRQIEANREFLLTILSQNPALLARAEPRIRQLMETLPLADSDGQADWAGLRHVVVRREAGK